MDPSAVLRQQSKNKICTDLKRMKNEQNKKPADARQSKHECVPYTSNKGTENQHPENSEIGRKAPVRQVGSRLPVLAKSLHLQTASNFRQSHCKWEENPLAGKAKKKRPCTRPVPFNFSQPRSSRVAIDKQPQTVMQTGTSTHQRNKCKAKPAIQPAALNSNPNLNIAKPKDVLYRPSVQTGPPSTFETSDTSSNSTKMMQNKTISTEFCLDNMNRLSIKDPNKASHVGPTSQQQEDTLKDKGENFYSDHKALLSILCNKGVDGTCVTPQSKQYNYLPQRVSVMKSRQKAGPTIGSVKSVQFSPDPAALQSILLNEGVKAGEPLDATPRNSACPPGWGTSIHTAQRVPVKKNQLETVDGPAVIAPRATPLNKWTPQRVSRHRPTSTVKWHQSTQPSTFTTPGFQNYKKHLKPEQQQEVVQRLFVDAEDQRNPDEDPDKCAQHLPVQASVCENTERQNRTSSGVEGDEQKAEDRRPFLQASDRESVIFFSTGKKLFRAPRLEIQDQGGPSSSGLSRLHLDEFSAESAGSHLNKSSERLYRDPITVKTCSLSPAVALLRKRLPPLEELRMDQEVATYTSMSVPAPGFTPARPRCGNPLASILHFEDSIQFVPIHCELLLGPSLHN